MSAHGLKDALVRQSHWLLLAFPIALFTFALFDSANSQVGETFTTDGLGHALSQDVPLGDYVLREVGSVDGIPASPDQPVTLASARVVVPLMNTVPPATTY